MMASSHTQKIDMICYVDYNTATKFKQFVSILQTSNLAAKYGLQQSWK